MKVYALLFTTGLAPGIDYEVFAVTHAGSLEMACRKFRVTPVPERSGYCRQAIRRHLPIPPKAENPDYVEVTATKDSGAEIGHVLSIPEHFNHMMNVGAWVCELPTID